MPNPCSQVVKTWTSRSPVIMPSKRRNYRQFNWTKTTEIYSCGQCWRVWIEDQALCAWSEYWQIVKAATWINLRHVIAGQ
jgi:hypothetical protein